MPIEWSPDVRGTYHALAHYSDSEDDDWTALCGAAIPPSLSQRIEREAPPQPSHRQCAEIARQMGGLGPRDVQRMVESGAFPPPDDPRWTVVTRQRRAAARVITSSVAGPLTVTEDTDIYGTVEGYATVAGDTLLAVDGVVTGGVTVEPGGVLEVGGVVGMDVLVRSGGRVEVFGTVRGSVILEQGATGLIHGTILGELSDPGGGAEVAPHARIGN